MTAAAPWPVLVVDDDRSTLDVTRMALDRVVVDGKRLELVTCQSAGAARQLLAEREFALAIVDVVMETHRAGLELVREMRAEPRHQLTQIVVRTGEPGEYPEAKVIEDFRISDYWPKAELRAPRMRASVIGLVRAHATALSLDAQVREKETLLREVHHRVKNNLQILLGLLALQGEGVDPATRHKLEETAGRIRSMALVHRELYQHESLVAIDAGAYLQTLAAELARTFDDSVQLQVQAETVLVGVDIAVPMGLIVNELLTNAVKHGRSPDGAARVSLTVARSEQGLRLAVEDRGPGWVGEGPVGHLGQQLVVALARQLRARVTREHAGGHRVVLELPLRAAG